MQITVFCGNKLCKSKLVIDTGAFNLDNPKVQCSVCGQYSQIDREFIGKLLLKEQNEKLELQKINIGFLIVHDENTKSQTFTLKTGRNCIGRKDADKPCDIMIETQDPYMSRNHCMIEGKMDRSGNIQLILYDPGSLNGTYLNENQKRLGKDDKVYLEDGDTIQIGKTKVMIKLIKFAKNSEEARKNVMNLPYSKTVIIQN
jgi:pSer/pThr/pTyr-binding forkhead associated (FHA) protein